MSTLSFAGIMVLGFIGFICVLLLLVLVAASLVRRELDDAAFRKELREAAQAEADYRKVDRSLKAHGRRRHSQAVCPFPARRGEER